MAQHDRYISPFSTRYASDEMQYIFSDDNKFRTWRKLWIALAKAEQKQGLAITDEQLAELEAHKDDINYEDAIAREKLVRHDVMSHVYAYGLQCPKAKGIIHLGATSCYVGDNTDVIVMREALQLVRKKIIGVLANLAKFADEYKAMPCLAYTHCQPAQLTTVGKRATLWMNELYMDLEAIDYQISQLALRGVKGTTGTQASFMELFNGDSAKIKAVEADVCAQMGFTKVVPVCGQTYSRKVDYNVLSAVAGHWPVCHARWRPTSACWQTSRRWRSRSRRIRSVPPPCPTSATPCAVSASARLSRYLMVRRAEPRHDRRHPVV